MTRNTWTCDWCQETWNNPHSANACCDDAMNSIEE